jgi:hypothetical protein
MAGEVLADPIGVIVDLIAAREPGLDRVIVETMVTSIAGGRAKRRELAQALLERPVVLADGRSRVPRGIGELHTLQRRGRDWYCRACGSRPKRCAHCG